jgi:hypothetical protein
METILKNKFYILGGIVGYALMQGGAKKFGGELSKAQFRNRIDDAQVKASIAAQNWINAHIFHPGGNMMSDPAIQKAFATRDDLKIRYYTRFNEHYPSE